MNQTTLIFLIIIGFSNLGNACKCKFPTFEEELRESKDILVGQIVEKNEGKYKIRIIKEWKSRATIREDDTITLIQELTSCTRGNFELNKIYLFYIKDNSVHNCSRTIEFSKTKDAELLDNKMTSFFYPSEIEYDKLNYERKYIIQEHGGKRIDIKNKTVIYIYKRKIISKQEIPDDISLFYPLNFYLIEPNKLNEVDYIFFIDNAHQERIGSPKLSKRLIKKIKRKVKKN